jgi:y4mF family transcriptional regulator
MSEPNPMKLSTFVRARRKANGMTQVELAELAGVGTRLVSELERGKPSIRMDVANRVLEVFGKELGVITRSKEE